MKYRVETFNEGLNDWILYAFASDVHDARAKMVKAAQITKATGVRMVSEKQFPQN